MPTFMYCLIILEMLFLLFFFFLMIRRPPRSTLFPTRRSSDLKCPQARLHRPAAFVAVAVGRHLRSAEHTSELQSQFHLVCRLLLEKKKNQNSGSPQKKKKKKHNITHNKQR